MKIIRSLLLLLACGLMEGPLLSAADSAATEAPQVSQLYFSGAGGNASYRIPVLLVTPAGTLLAFCDDHGRTWRLGGSVGDRTGECTVVELAGGRLLLNARPHPGGFQHRYVSTSSDGGETWTAPAAVSDLPDPDCQGSLIRCSLQPASSRNRLLFSNPASTTKREHLTVRLSYDEGQTWLVAKELEPKRSGYSSLAVLPDGSVGCLFENRNARDHAIISFARFTLAWLTDGKDSGQ